MTNLHTLVAVTTLTLLGCTIARADDTAASHAAVVRYADLDLNNARGAAALYQRIRGAAHSVCRDLESRSLAFQERYSACVHEAIAKALTDVDRTNVTAYVAMRGVAGAK
jgi:UrcA family protein